MVIAPIVGASTIHRHAERSNARLSGRRALLLCFDVRTVVEFVARHVPLEPRNKPMKTLVSKIASVVAASAIFVPVAAALEQAAKIFA